MGVPKIKAKIAVNYRSSRKGKKCSLCRSFQGALNRCPVIGLNSGRGYAISPRGVCDRFEPSECGGE